MTRFHSIALLVFVALAIGCGSAEEAADSAAKATQDAASAAADAAAEAADEAKAAADAAAAKAQAAAADAKAAVADATTPSPKESCIELAGKEMWLEAVEPCTVAAKNHPDDLEIRHNLQQAQAGAMEAGLKMLEQK